nr:MAG: hypothetical protein [Molluscum contagiosum virus]
MARARAPFRPVNGPQAVPADDVLRRGQLLLQVPGGAGR